MPLAPATLHIPAEYRRQGIREEAAALDFDGILRGSPETRPTCTGVKFALAEKERRQAARADEGSLAFLGVELRREGGFGSTP